MKPFLVELGVTALFCFAILGVAFAQTPDVAGLTSDRWRVELVRWDWVLWATVTGIAVFGVYASYLRRWAQGAIAGGLRDYLRANRRNTVLSMFTLMGGLWTALIAGMYEGATFFLTVTSAFTAGFGVDTVANGNKIVAEIKKEAVLAETQKGETP